MRFKLPKYKRFDFEPRYYDPVKEEVEKRERLIKGAFRREQQAEGAKNRISDAFQKRQRESKKPVMIQAGIVIVLLGIMAYVLMNLEKWL